MATDFSAVKVTYDSTTGVGTLTGKARGPKAMPVHITETIEAEDGSSEQLVSDGTRSLVTDLAVKITAVSDDVGGTYTVNPDGQGYKLNA